MFPGADESSRSFRKEVAEGLAMSIEAQGMYHPIAVRDDPDEPGHFRGVQGRHRLHAQHRILGRTIETPTGFFVPPADRNSGSSVGLSHVERDGSRQPPFTL